MRACGFVSADQYESQHFLSSKDILSAFSFLSVFSPISNRRVGTSMDPEIIKKLCRMIEMRLNATES